MQELDLRNSQAIVAQLDTLYSEVGFEQAMDLKTKLLKGEVDEVIEAEVDYVCTPSPELRRELADELGDVLFLTLSKLNDLGEDAVDVLNRVFTKNLGRVNREHIAQTRERLNGNGQNPVALYKAAKASYDNR